MKARGGARFAGLSTLTVIVVLAAACAHPPVAPVPAADIESTQYTIGPGDTLNVFVWGNPQLSTTVPVRPDGKITTPLVEDVPAAGKTPTQLARDMEQQLSHFIRNPVVTVVVTNIVGMPGENIRVVGAAAKPQALPYREHLSLLDVMIAVGGLNEYAAGNRARIVRKVNGKEIEIRARIDDLLKNGDIRANIEMRPGDILIIPEAWF
jgi:polysaccharide export outer membrane protein